jgi:putative ABC transport system ATP-binding protein
MVSIQHLTHRFGDRQVLDIPALDADQGSTWLLLGVSGSGKTTLLHIVAGLLRPTSGAVVVADQPLDRLSGAPLDTFRGRHIGIVFQQMHLLATLTALENVLLAPYLAGLLQDRRRAEALLESLELGSHRDVFPHQLSYGQKQRLSLARALMNRPRVVLADEPTSALDDMRCAQVGALLLEQTRQHGATLLVATHDARLLPAFEHRFDVLPMDGYPAEAA